MQTAEEWGYRTVKISLSKLQPFSTDPLVWQTDRRAIARYAYLNVYVVSRVKNSK